MAVVRPIGVYLLDFFSPGIQFYLLLSPYLCFVSFLCLDLYVLGDDALISQGSLMQTKHLCALNKAIGIKTFSKFYRRYYDLISKFQVGLKSLLRQGLSEPELYGELVYKLKKIVGSNNFSAQVIRVISHYKKIGYNINVLQQSACLVVNPITVGNFAFLFHCTPVGRTSGSMTVPT